MHEIIVMYIGDTLKKNIETKEAIVIRTLIIPLTFVLKSFITTEAIRAVTTTLIPANALLT